MGNPKEFGLHVYDGIPGILLDSYSTPDSWFDMGYEIEFIFTVLFPIISSQSQRSKVVDDILQVSEDIFNLGKGHYKCHYNIGSELMSHIEQYFGEKYQAYKIGSPVPERAVFQINVLWDSGALDLRKLSSLANQINAIGSKEKVIITLISLCIIPRAKNTIALKQNEGE